MLFKLLFVPLGPHSILSCLLRVAVSYEFSLSLFLHFHSFSLSLCSRISYVSRLKNMQESFLCNPFFTSFCFKLLSHICLALVLLNECFFNVNIILKEKVEEGERQKPLWSSVGLFFFLILFFFLTVLLHSFLSFLQHPAPLYSQPWASFTCCLQRRAGLMVCR